MGAASFFSSRGLTTVAGRTYPGTYSIATVSNFMAEQVANRDSASWKKAEHIAIEMSLPDVAEHRRIIARWRMLTDAEPYGRSIQKLYISIGMGRYAKYDAMGSLMGEGTLADLVGGSV